MAKKKSHKFSEQLRQAIDESGLSRYVICQETGIDQAALSRFMHGTRGLSLDSIDLISELLQLTITTGGNAARKKGK